VRDKHLMRQDYFDIARFPEIRLRSKTLHKKARHSFSGTFDLTIKNKTKEVSIDFVRITRRDKIRYEAIFDINRIDFNIGEKSILLDETVRVSVIAITNQ
jgi:polyisoprenoid-binding protein YceI